MCIDIHTFILTCKHMHTHSWCVEEGRWHRTLTKPLSSQDLKDASLIEIIKNVNVPEFRPSSKVTFNSDRSCFSSFNKVAAIVYNRAGSGLPMLIRDF